MQLPKSFEDMSNYGMLLREVRTALTEEGRRRGREFGLTATLPCGHDDMEYIDIGFLASVLTEFNLLSVDFHGPWDGKAGANAPLHDPSGEDDSVNGCVLKYTEGGAPKNRINVGLSFHGQSFRGSNNMGDECEANRAGDCSDGDTWQEDGGSL